ncbi:DUF952 domain-containing protein [Fodinibius salsisoli]|uniref:DUF952 domain-containing protein n=1 Tax=Fodinibius salsisoli TaxID=2820877 RepID=A0ABT3PJV2_9BACT|nr:DUF952 domain-containing protein [Fodinibius salsisoli]MCW9706202.1 DUF952 domain-containing protein [Fodinibius salsisoli]
MREDIIFHITTKAYFNSHKKSHEYVPESLDTEGFIHSSKGDQVEATANRIFAEETQLLLLVIDVSTLTSEVKYEQDESSGETYPHIYGPINIDAIMDKLDIHAEKSGEFKIAFSSNT